jgi:putative ABC transport system ATP-binding protein
MKQSNKVIIKVSNLIKDYGKGALITHVLKGITFEVYDGEFIGIMGPSGCGKSTTLHQLGLLDEPTSGKIHINGTEVTSLPELKRSYFRLYNLGYVFQQYRNIPELTAVENVFLPARMIGKQKEEYISYAKSLLNDVGLGHRLNYHPYEMSGGEQQRVAIARALINKPAILFADEPTANLDSVAGDHVLQLLTKFNKGNDQTIIMVTHEPEHAKYFDRIIRIKDGVVERIEINRKK